MSSAITSITSRPTLDDYFAQLLPIVATRGTCIRRKVAAIVTDEAGHLLGTGYNGPPAGDRHCVDHPCEGAQDKSGNNRRCQAIHAEMNALLQAGVRLPEATRIYVSLTPCFDCAKLIVTAKGIKRVTCLELYRGDMSGLRYLISHNVEVFIYDRAQQRNILATNLICYCGGLGLNDDGTCKVCNKPV